MSFHDKALATILDAHPQAVIGEPRTYYMWDESVPQEYGQTQRVTHYDETPPDQYHVEVRARKVTWDTGSAVVVMPDDEPQAVSDEPEWPKQAASMVKRFGRIVGKDEEHFVYTHADNLWLGNGRAVARVPLSKLPANLPPVEPPPSGYADMFDLLLKIDSRPHYPNPVSRYPSGQRDVVAVSDGQIDIGVETDGVYQQTAIRTYVPATHSQWWSRQIKQVMLKTSDYTTGRVGTLPIWAAYLRNGEAWYITGFAGSMIEPLKMEPAPEPELLQDPAECLRYFTDGTSSTSAVCVLSELPAATPVPEPQANDVTAIGTLRNPLRASGLDTLVRCEMLWYYRLMHDDPVGPAAHTGTAIGRAIELWHIDRGRDLRSILSQVAVESTTVEDPYPDYDAGSVDSWIKAYTADPRNHIAVVGQESEVNLVLDPHEHDPTGIPIVIRGHLDQLRDLGTHRELWDVKSGRGSGSQMLTSYTLQLAAYLVGLQDTEYAPVSMGGIIRVRDYDKRQQPYQVFYRLPLDLESAHILLDSIRLRVAAIRSGEVCISPGRHCSYCPLHDVSGCTYYARTGRIPSEV